MNASQRADRRRLAGWASGVSPLAGGRRDGAAPAAETAAVHFGFTTSSILRREE